MNIHLSPKSHESIELEGFRSSLFAKLTTFLTIFLFSSVFYLSPTAKAVADEISKEDRERELREQQITAVMESTPEAKLAYRLQKMKEKVVNELTVNAVEREQEQGLMSRALRTLGFGDLVLTSAEIAELSALKADIEAAYLEANQQFLDVHRNLANSALLGEDTINLMKERQREAVNQVEQHYSQLTSTLNVIITTTDTHEQLTALLELDSFLEGQQFKRQHTAEDPNRMPWGSPSQTVREPALSAEDLLVEPQSSISRMATSTVNNKTVNDIEPHAEYLNENIEVQFTPDIKALALSLNNNPTEIYAWVHNNIQFIPSYGSIQGAQMTLETKSGNAIDTASLLISLLRSAGIPARYAYGSVEVPAAKVMNWVGNVNNAEAALNLMGQGGIPSIGVSRGGVITDIRFEHTWVEAWVDFEPSRGVKNAQGDNWIPMDASFKQYEYKGKLILGDDLISDAEGALVQLQNNSVVNENQGWIKPGGLPEVQEKLEIVMDNVIQAAKDTSPNNKISEILGLGSINILPVKGLASTLPYIHLTTSRHFNEVPNSLRHMFKYELYTSSNSFGGAEILNIIQPTAKLAGSNISLSFRPASAADEELVQSSLPSLPTSDQDLSIDAVPNNLPGYLIKLRAEFNIDGVIINSGESGTLGGELVEQIGLWSPSNGWNVSTNTPISGEYRAIGLDLQGYSSGDLTKESSRYAETKDLLLKDALSSLNKHNTIGSVLQGVIKNYFLINDSMDRQLANIASISTYRLPSYGIFSTSLRPAYWFGIPRNVEFSGMNMDVDFMHYQTVDKNNTQANVIQFLSSVGARASALEHVVPEEMLSTEESRATAISAVKALAIAASQGQKLWQIDGDNLEQALNDINLSLPIENEIRNSVRMGRVVSTHSTNLNYQGWFGAGYIIMDPETGAAAYKISGGSNGGDTLPGNLLIGSGGLLGITDAYTAAKNPNGEPWFSKVLKKIWNQGQLSKWTGWLGLGVALGLVAFDDGLSTSNKVGQASMNLLGFGITAYLIGALAVLAGPISFLGVAILGLIIALTIAIAVTLVNIMYFTRLLRKNRRHMLIC